MSDAELSSSSCLRAPSWRRRRRVSQADLVADTAMTSLRRQASTCSTQSENDLLLKKTKSSSSSYSRSRRHSPQKLNEMHSFTVEELPNMLDVGYDADVEVVRPYECDEPESDADSSMSVDLTNGQGSSEAQLADRLKGLKLRSRMHRRYARVPRAARLRGTDVPRANKRTFSESFESDTIEEGTDIGVSDPGSPHDVKRPRRGRGGSNSQSTALWPMDDNLSIEETNSARKPIISEKAGDAMDIDEGIVL